jgi:hypothetical protein
MLMLFCQAMLFSACMGLHVASVHSPVQIFQMSTGFSNHADLLPEQRAGACV